MKKNILLLGLLLTSSAFALNDGFNFSECSGSRNFEQQIQHYGGDYEKAITVGTIPTGIKGLKIELNSDKDVDIRLYGQKNDKIVHWPYGMLNGPTEGIAPYQGTNIRYSGYNGTNGQKGHEFITVEGTTAIPMTMKAFGYRAGFATVNYSWTGKEGCDNSGDGNFTQSIVQDTLSLVGEIPTGVPNVHVALTSDKDLDIQLYGTDGTVIVGWKPVGLLSGANLDTVEYNGMSIEWSGYDGTNGNKGHEYIQITGSTTEALTMKIYGYEAGFADVMYSWHENNTSTECTEELMPVCGYSPINGDLKTFQNSCLLEESNFTFGYDGECDSNICTSWYDGCNECSIDSTGNPICTEMACIQKEDYVCHTWGEDVEPTPIPTPIPTVTPTPQPCPDIYEPVCGKYMIIGGQKTFNNICELQTTGNVAYVHDGECNATIEPTPIPTPTPKPCLDIYKPVCGILIYNGIITGGSHTYMNLCELENSHATLLYDGECDTTIEPTPTPTPTVTPTPQP